MKTCISIQVLIFSALLSSCVMFSAVEPGEVPEDLMIQKEPEGEDYLQFLINETLKNNTDLEISAFRLKSAGWFLSAARAPLFPRLSGGFSGGRNNQGVDTLTGKSITVNEWGVNLDMGWDIDLWGQLADGNRAQKLRFESDGLLYNQMKNSLIVRVIQSWAELVMIDKSLALLNERVRVLRIYESVCTDQYRRGLIGAETRADIRIRLALAEDDAAAQRFFLEKCLMKMTLLTGGLVPRAPGSQADFPELSLPSGETPLAILGDRPDIQGALKRYEAAAYETRSTRKSALPNVRLSSRLFRQTAKLSSLDTASNSWSLLGSLFLPLFDGGRIWSETKARHYEEEAALCELRDVSLKAIVEIQTARWGEEEWTLRITALESAIEEVSNTMTLMEERYRQGMVDYRIVLDTTEQTLTLKTRLIEARGSQLINRASLALSLGMKMEEI